MSASRTGWGSSLLLGLCIAASGCVSAPDPQTPHEYLDPATAATIDVVGKPLVFAREHPERAVHMRDYVTVAAAMVDRSGKTDLVLVAYFWTTLDAHGRETTADRATPLDATGEHSSDAPLQVLADGRLLELPLRAHSAAEAGIGVPVHAPHSRHTTPNVYTIDLPTLRFLASARHIDLMAGASFEDRYRLWDDQRTSLAMFVTHLSGAPN